MGFLAYTKLLQGLHLLGKDSTEPLLQETDGAQIYDLSYTHNDQNKIKSGNAV